MKTESLLQAIHTATPQTLHRAYEAVCETYKQRLTEQLGFNINDVWWVDQTGGILDLSSHYLEMSDIVMLVDKGIGYDDFIAWYDQWTDMNNVNRINLRSWIAEARPNIFL